MLGFVWKIQTYVIVKLKEQSAKEAKNMRIEYEPYTINNDNTVKQLETGKQNLVFDA